MDPQSWVMLAVLLFTVLLSAFFSASETACMAASRVRLKTLGQSGNRRADAALHLIEDSDRLLTTILVGNNLVNIAGTAIATVLFTRWLNGSGATVATVVMTVLILLFGEVAPKTLARQSPEGLAMGFAPVLRLLCVIFTPVNWLFARWQRLLKRIFHPAEEEPDIEAELITMVDEAQQEGGIDDHESDLIRSAIEFVDQDVKDIMTPRVDVTALPEDATMEEAAAAFRESGYSRLPVYREDLDHVVGILNEKDFYAALHDGQQSIRHVMTAPVYTPATLKISKLLKLCQSTRNHLVIVLDEYGGMEGIVTLEDALEELVGEIYDEHDDVIEEMTEVGDRAWQVDGRMQLDDLLERLGVTGTYEADTVGGWAAEMLDGIPTVGMAFDEAGLHCIVTGMDRRRVTRMRISKPEPAAEEPQPAEHPKQATDKDRRNAT
ncbi:MAG: HlyC/CorC family transporter [Clostridia bacterium]|nr:HlyC/CorC family transporter [Clostridia bacterium]